MESSRDFGKKEGRVIQVNEGELKKHVSEIVRESVEDTLNGLLEAEADSLCQARRSQYPGGTLYKEFADDLWRVTSRIFRTLSGSIG